MDTCHKCGANLRKDAKFCSRCGTPVQKTLFCHQCGAELNVEDQFCYACGASVQETPPSDPAPLKRDGVHKKAGSGNAKKDVSKTIVYPDVRGLHPSGSRLVSVSDRAIVFGCGSSSLYRADKEMNGIYRNWLDACALTQTKDGILVLEEDYDTMQAILHTLDDRLQTTSKQPLFDISVDPGYYYAMNARWAVGMSCCEVDDGLLDRIEQDFIIRCVDLESGERWDWEMEHPEVEGKQIVRINDRLLIDKNFLYLFGGVLGKNKVGEPDQCDAAFRFNLLTGQFELLWLAEEANRRYVYGKPCIYDFEKQVMWTFPRKMEMKRRNWEATSTKWGAMLPLVPRKLKKDSPILANYRIYPMAPAESYEICYFDTEHGFIYFKPDSHNMYAIIDEQISSDWRRCPHGFGSNTVGWNGHLISDLEDDYRFKVYRMEFERDEHNPGVALNAEDVTPAKESL